MPHLSPLTMFRNKQLKRANKKKSPVVYSHATQNAPDLI